MKIIVSLLIISWGTSPVFAQSSSSKHVQVSARTQTGIITRGSVFNAELVLRIAKGWHINSHTPTQDYLIGTSFSLDPAEGFEISKIQYPEGKSIKLAMSETPLSVYDDTISITITVKIANSVRAGTNSLSGKITVQACNDRVCVAPATIPVRIPVEIGI
jgi:DsbC/DsbD-like thiol-disulfide interchange protein